MGGSLFNNQSVGARLYATHQNRAQAYQQADDFAYMGEELGARWTSYLEDPDFLSRVENERVRGMIRNEMDRNFDQCVRYLVRESELTNLHSKHLDQYAKETFIEIANAVLSQTGHVPADACDSRGRAIHRSALDFGSVENLSELERTNNPLLKNRATHRPGEVRSLFHMRGGGGLTMPNYVSEEQDHGDYPLSDDAYPMIGEEYMEKEPHENASSGRDVDIDGVINGSIRVFSQDFVIHTGRFSILRPMSYAEEVFDLVMSTMGSRLPNRYFVQVDVPMLVPIGISEAEFQEFRGRVLQRLDDGMQEGVPAAWVETLVAEIKASKGTVKERLETFFIDRWNDHTNLWMSSSVTCSAVICDDIDDFLMFFPDSGVCDFDTLNELRSDQNIETYRALFDDMVNTVIKQVIDRPEIAPETLALAAKNQVVRPDFSMLPADIIREQARVARTTQTHDVVNAHIDRLADTESEPDFGAKVSDGTPIVSYSDSDVTMLNHRAYVYAHKRFVFTNIVSALHADQLFAKIPFQDDLWIFFKEEGSRSVVEHLLTTFLTEEESANRCVSPVDSEIHFITGKNKSIVRFGICVEGELAYYMT